MLTMALPFRPPPLSPLPSGRPWRETSYLHWMLVRPRGAASEDMEARCCLEAAVYAAGLRARESLRAEPLFHDPYAACLAALNLAADSTHSCGGAKVRAGSYEVATRFIDDKLVEIVKDSGSQVLQIVLLTDGMDTRPFRLPWPAASLIFDISPGPIFQIASETLKGVGAKVPKMCLLQHVTAELANGEDWRDEGWGDMLTRLGFRGDRPSVWAMQGLHGLTAEGLQVILGHASSMAMKGCVFVGELPLSALGDTSTEVPSNLLMRVFGGNGFDVSVISLEEIAARVGLEETHVEAWGWREKCPTLVFVAKQLRLSDGQVEFARQQIEQAEDAGDEEGFEEW